MGITLESVDKAFGEEQALVDVNLSVASGEFCVVIGPSGCGKTTLLNCVAGLVRPDSGDVRHDGTSVLDVPVSDRGFGVVFQDFEDRLFPHLTVRENVAFALERIDDTAPTEVDRRVEAVLDLLAISETRDDYPQNLSGGQQQRVELARQLVRETETLLLDDPLSDLDYKLQKRLELELRRLHEAEDDTILYVTHNQDQSLKLADRLVVMNRGLVEQVAPPDAVYADPATAFVARFVGDSNLLATSGVESDGELVHAETPVGHIHAEASDKSNGGNTGGGVVLVRPEDLSFGSGENTVTGVLEQRISTGETTEFIISLPGEVEEFQLRKPGNVPLSTITATVGDEVAVSWDIADTHYFGPNDLSATGELTVSEVKEV